MVDEAKYEGRNGPAFNGQSRVNDMKNEKNTIKMKE
jgi:hypothetical protein